MIRKAITLMSLAALSACSLAPKYIRPELPVPPSWPVGDAYLRQSEAALPSVTYRDIFRDPRLQRIIEQALANNRDLRIAAANIAIARAQYRIQRAEQLPGVDASANFTRSDAGTGRTSNGGAPVSGGARDNFSTNLGINAFEIDLFGRVRSLSTAAQNRYFATEAAARATRLTLVGDIATAWLTYASDQSLLKIARDTAANAERSVSLTRLRLDGGIAPRTDLAQAQIVLQTAQSDLATQTTAVAQDVNALQLLVGAPVDPALLPASIEEAAATVVELPAGVDSAVLLRRPDVVQAEYELRATNAEIGAAPRGPVPAHLAHRAGRACQQLAQRVVYGRRVQLFDRAKRQLSDLPGRRRTCGRRAVAGAARLRARLIRARDPDGVQRSRRCARAAWHDRQSARGADRADRVGDRQLPAVRRALSRRDRHFPPEPGCTALALLGAALARNHAADRRDQSRDAVPHARRRCDARSDALRPARGRAEALMLHPCCTAACSIGA